MHVCPPLFSWLEEYDQLLWPAAASTPILRQTVCWAVNWYSPFIPKLFLLGLFITATARECSTICFVKNIILSSVLLYFMSPFFAYFICSVSQMDYYHEAISTTKFILWCSPQLTQPKPLSQSLKEWKFYHHSLWLFQISLLSSPSEPQKAVNLC